MSEQTELKVGDKLRDQDPRMSHRAQLTITHILPNGVQAENGRGQAVTILRRRIYTDGKPRRNGFALVRNAS
jgi:hypothetical protein